MPSDPCHAGQAQTKSETDQSAVIEALRSQMSAVQAKMSSMEDSFKRLSRIVVIGTSLGLLASLFRLIGPSDSKPVPIQPPVPVVAPTTNTAEGGSVKIGLSDGIDSQKTYLTTKEVAEKEGVSQRTVNAWILEGRVDPKPEQSDRAWHIAVDYRILPLTAGP